MSRSSLLSNSFINNNTWRNFIRLSPVIRAFVPIFRMCIANQGVPTSLSLSLSEIRISNCFVIKKFEVRSALLSFHNFLWFSWDFRSLVKLLCKTCWNNWYMIKVQCFFLRIKVYPWIYPWIFFLKESKENPRSRSLYFGTKGKELKLMEENIVVKLLQLFLHFWFRLK